MTGELRQELFSLYMDPVLQVVECAVIRFKCLCERRSMVSGGGAKDELIPETSPALLLPCFALPCFQSHRLENKALARDAF